MDFEPLFASTPVIQLHAFSALLAAALGTVILLMRKGTRLHKAMGRTWVAVMLVVALSSFLIAELRMFGPYSWIHALSLYTLFALGQGVWYIRRGNIKGHKMTMIALYGAALLLTGGFTLLPGRRMHAVIFADGGVSAGLVALAILMAVGLVLLGRRLRT